AGNAGPSAAKFHVRSSGCGRPALRSDPLVHVAGERNKTEVPEMVEGDIDWYDPEKPAEPYTHGGRPLADWLIQLVSDDYAKRKPAGDAVLAIGQPYRF